MQNDNNSAIGIIEIHGKGSKTIVDLINDIQKEFEFASNYPIYAIHGDIRFPVMDNGLIIPYTPEEIMSYVQLDKTKISVAEINASLFDRARRYINSQSPQNKNIR